MFVKTGLDKWEAILSYFMVFLFHAFTCTIFFKAADKTAMKRI